MIYTMIHGGLGNQLFQYAAAKNLSVRHGTDLRMDLSKMMRYDLRSYSLDKFEIPQKIASPGEVKKFCSKNKYLNHFFKLASYFFNVNRQTVYEKNEFTFDPRLLKVSEGYLCGYWQSFRYFNEIRELLLKEFVLKEELDLINRQTLAHIQEVDSVSIHIRRGDYTRTLRNRKLYDVLDPNYYEKAISLVSAEITDPQFFVFSDDQEWAKKKFGHQKFNYVDNNEFTAEKDLILMSSCKHNIIANSTFSWWAAWLNQNENKIIIAPKRWISRLNDTSDLYPPEWKIL